MFKFFLLPATVCHIPWVFVQLCLKHTKNNVLKLSAFEKKAERKKSKKEFRMHNSCGLLLWSPSDYAFVLLRWVLVPFDKLVLWQLLHLFSTVPVAAVVAAVACSIAWVGHTVHNAEWRVQSAGSLGQISIHQSFRQAVHDRHAGQTANNASAGHKATIALMIDIHFSIVDRR